MSYTNVLNYKTIIIEAESLDDVRKAIINDKMIRKEFIIIENREACKECKNCMGLKYLSCSQCDADIDKFDDYIDEYYYNNDIIEDMQNTYYDAEFIGFRYMGIGDTAYKNFLKYNTSADCKCGHKMFYGKKLSRSADASYGINMYSL